MSILNVNTIQPIGSGTTVTVAATELKTSNFITVGTGASITSPSANVLTLGTNTAERFRITSAGSIGIGTDNPGTKLDVRGGNWSNGDIVVGQSGNAGRIKFRRGADGSDSGSIGFAAADNNSRLAINVASGDGTIAFQTNSAERVLIDSSGFITQKFTSNNSTTAEGLFINNLNNGTGNNASLILSNDSGERKKAAIALIDTGSYGAGDLVFALDGADSGELHLTNDEKLRITSAGVIQCGTSATLKAEINNSVSGHQFISQCSDNNNGFEVYQQHASNTTRNNFAVYANTGSGNAKNLQFAVRGDGAVTKPGQPLAVIGTTQNNLTPSTGSIIQFDYAATNRGNHYNTSNYTFTCPVAGDYMVIFRHSRKGWCGDLDLQKNGTTHALLELRETGLNGAGTPVPDWQAGSYSFIVPCAANDVLRWRVGATYTATGSGGYLLDGYNHIKYDAVTYYLIG